jgi:hypothetical protein
MQVSPLVFIDLPTDEDDDSVFNIDLDKPDEPVDKYAIEAAALREELKKCLENKLPAYEVAIERDSKDELKDAEEIKLAAEACVFALGQTVPRRDEELYKKAETIVKKRLEKKK